MIKPDVPATATTEKCLFPLQNCFLSAKCLPLTFLPLSALAHVEFPAALSHARGILTHTPSAFQHSLIVLWLTNHYPFKENWGELRSPELYSIQMLQHLPGGKKQRILRAHFNPGFARERGRRKTKSFQLFFVTRMFAP